MKSVEKVLKQGLFMQNIYLGVIGLGLVGILLPTIYLSVFIGLIVIVYALLMWPMVSEILEQKKIYNILILKVRANKEDALEYLRKEINDIELLLRMPKTEMDIHAFNATNERKAMKASISAENAIRKKLGLYKRVEKMLVVFINDEKAKDIYNY